MFCCGAVVDDLVIFFDYDSDYAGYFDFSHVVFGRIDTDNDLVGDTHMAGNRRFNQLGVLARV